MTAALYALRAGKTVLILEAEGIGGQIAFTPRIENYPAIPSLSGAEFADSLFSQAMSFGGEFSLEKVSAIIAGDTLKGVPFNVKTDDGEYNAKTVILALGAKHRKLGVKGEEEFFGEGISYCALCDGAFFNGKNVFVIGGGNTAITSAILLSSYCKKVTVVQFLEELTAEVPLIKTLKQKENVELILNSQIAEFKGDKELKSVAVKNNASEKITDIPADGVFINVGTESNAKAFENLIKMDEYGYILTDENMETNVKGIFAAGDCRSKKVRQLTTATADGTIAAMSAVRTIQNS